MIWSLLVAFGVFFILTNGLPPALVYAERKLAAGIQNRVGPNRVGPYGLLQPIADAIKLLFKEDVTPRGADKFLFSIAPILSFVPAALAFAIIPFGNYAGEVRLQVADLNVGILFATAIISLGAYGIAFGGWASNSKFPLLAAVRSSAQLISYEVVMALALVAMIMTYGTVRTEVMVLAQAVPLAETGPFAYLPAWGVFQQPIAFVLFVICCFAENNRAPFDMPECEAELVGGYHTEYSSMKFALFFQGEYIAMTTMSALIVTIFLGGWHFPGMDVADHSVGMGILTILVFMAKLLGVLFFYIWVRWTLPRFRYDQVMRLCWKGCIPIALVNIAITGIIGVLYS